MTTTIFTAKRVITMNRANPFAEAVAVRDGRVLGAGSLEVLAGWGDHVVDDRFADKVLTPGFIEAHSHMMAGGLWELTYIGFFDRKGPDGRVWPGCKTFDDVIDRLKEAEELLEPGETLHAWGLDPIYFDGLKLTAAHLDKVSETRPIFIQHASGHLATVNTAMLEISEITADSPTPGISKLPNGDPDGELQEPAAMSLAVGGSSGIRDQPIETTSWNYANEALNAGQTLITDLSTPKLDDPEHVAKLHEIIDHKDFPCRLALVIAHNFGQRPDGHLTLPAVGAALKAQPSDKVKYGVVKIILDGSIQGFTARISWPQYYNPPEGHPGNGLWLVAPEQMAEIVAAYHNAGLTVHCHCNGDEATAVFLDAVEAALEANPRWDHRHTVQHCQLTTKAQYRRMAAMGMCANIFSNHMFYWGDQHRDLTVGPERARGMDACATALSEGVSFSIHSDAPVTPMGSLHVAWCAVNRLTASGDVLGEDECISVEAALHAITLGAAHQLKLDHEMGSIEAGKYADFAVLDEDPYEVDPTTLKDIGVWGTVLGGVPFEASRPE